MEKIRFITDTASDIPDASLRQHDNIVMCSIPITIDGEGYYERKSFSIREFYGLLAAAGEIPTTSRIPVNDYMDCYQKAWEDGCTHVFNVTINAGGSGIYAAALMARDAFFEEHPKAREEMTIHVLDSGTYTMAYGYPVLQGARMAREGRRAEDILRYLRDFFDRVEIYLGCYSLEYAKKSGRISAAAAFVGDVLGLRPIIQMIDGETRVIEKVRGDKNLAGRIFAAYQACRLDSEDPVLVMRGSLEDPVPVMEQLVAQDTGRSAETFYAGASIVINAGPRIIALVCLGKPRGRAWE